MEKYLVVYATYRKMLQAKRKDVMELLKSIDDDGSDEIRVITNELMGLASHIGTCIQLVDLNTDKIKRKIFKEKA